MAKNAKTTVIGGLLLIVIGIGLIAGILIYKKSADAKLASWPRTTAVVVAVERTQVKEDDDYVTKYVPVLEYTVDGKTYRMRDSAKNIAPLLGSTQTIAYNPDNPSKRISAQTGTLVPTVIFVAFGALSSVMGIIVLAKGIKDSLR